MLTNEMFDWEDCYPPEVVAKLKEAMKIAGLVPATAARPAVATLRKVLHIVEHTNILSGALIDEMRVALDLADGADI